MASLLAAQWARMLETSPVSLGLSTQLLPPLTVPSQSSLYLEVPSSEVSTRPGSVRIQSQCRKSSCELPGSRILWNILISSLVNAAKPPLFRFGYLSDVSCTGARAPRELKVENTLFREPSLSKAHCPDISHKNIKGICFFMRPVLVYSELLVPQSQYKVHTVHCTVFDVYSQLD